jgi:hypothetical protein
MTPRSKNLVAHIETLISLLHAETDPTHVVDLATSIQVMAHEIALIEGNELAESIEAEGRHI